MYQGDDGYYYRSPEEADYWYQVGAREEYLKSFADPDCGDYHEPITMFDQWWCWQYDVVRETRLRAHPEDDIPF